MSAFVTELRENFNFSKFEKLVPNDFTADWWFEKHRWPDCRTCPNCGSRETSEVPEKNPMPYHCPKCSNYFGPKTGSPFARSKITIRQCLFALYFRAVDPNGFSSERLCRDIGVTKKAAASMIERVAEAWSDWGPRILGSIEVGEYPSGENLLERRREIRNFIEEPLPGLRMNPEGAASDVGTPRSQRSHMDNLSKTLIQSFSRQGKCGSTLLMDRAMIREVVEMHCVRTPSLETILGNSEQDIDMIEGVARDALNQGEERQDSPTSLNSARINPAFDAHQGSPLPTIAGQTVHRCQRGDMKSIVLSDPDRKELERLVADRNTSKKVHWRAHIVLLKADGHGSAEIQRRTGTSKTTVLRWTSRYMDEGVEGLKRDRTRPPGRPPIPLMTVLKVIVMTVYRKPKHIENWSCSLMAEEAGISRMSVHRIWRMFGLKPHLKRTFKISNGQEFREKVMDIAPLCIRPPEGSMVISVDEKTQMQPLERSQMGLLMKYGQAGTITHDYKRHGTTTLFAGLCVATGKTIHMFQKRHRTKEFLKFLRKIDKEVPPHLKVHIILDNYATHKTPAVKAWLKKNNRFTFHFTPTNASWLNLVDRLFSEIASRCLKNASFQSQKELEDRVLGYLDNRNFNPTRFVWNKTAEEILEKEERALFAFDMLRGNR